MVLSFSSSLMQNVTLEATWIDGGKLKYTVNGNNITITGFEDDTDKAEVRLLNIGETYDEYNVVEIAEGAFSGCSALERITLPFVGSNATATEASASTLLGYIFGNDSYSNAIVAQQFYSASSYSGFYIPRTLKIVTITGGKVLYGSFSSCTGLENISIPNSITSIEERCFYNCTGLIDFSIPENVTSIEKESFKFCGKLESVTIPDSVESIGVDAFSNCSSLSSLTMSGSVKSIGQDAFAKCDLLRKVNYLGAIEQWCGIDFDNLQSNPIVKYDESLYLNNELVTEINIPNTVTEIKDYAFWGLSSIQNVTVPDSIEKVGVQVFAYCENLQYNTDDNIKYLGNDTHPYLVAIEAIYRNLTEYNCQDTTKVLYDACFSGSTEMTSIVIPNTVISISENAFASCAKLERVTMSENINYIGGNAFFNCGNLSSIIIPEKVESIGYKAFDGLASNLETVYIESSTIAKELDVYSSCGHLVAYADTVYIKESITTIGSYITENYTKGSTTVVDGITYNTYTKNE